MMSQVPCMVAVPWVSTAVLRATYMVAVTAHIPIPTMPLWDRRRSGATITTILMMFLLQQAQQAFHLT